ncbi:hypothetical protein OAI66_00810 [Gammaproteobacteria bacterium]|nr:hypothetical protein [Gammaproteobacteria bacterium]
MIQAGNTISKHGNIVALFSFFLALTVLFPEVGLVKSTDVQPNFFFLASISTFIFLGRVRLSTKGVLYFTLCLLSLLLSFIVHHENITWTYILKYSIALISFYLCYVLYSNGLLSISNKLIVFAIIVYVLVAVMQFIIPDFLTFLVSRSQTQSTQDLLSSGRGMLSLTGEPAHFGKAITILNLLYVFNSLTSEDKYLNYRLLLFISFFLFLLNCILSQSFYACAFHLVCFIGISYILDRKLTYFFLVSSGLGLVTMISYLLTVFPDLRLTTIANDLIFNPELLLVQGAMLRVLNIPLTFLTLSNFGFWGSGNSSIIFSNQLNLGFGILEYTTSNRLFGGFIEYILKMGFLSAPLVMAYLYMIATISKLTMVLSGSIRYVGIIFAGMLLLLSSQDGSLASPLMIFTVVCIFLKSKVLLKGLR